MNLVSLEPISRNWPKTPQTPPPSPKHLQTPPLSTKHLQTPPPSPKHLLTPPLQTIGNFQNSTFLDITRLFSTDHQKFSKFDISRHYSTFLDISRHFSTLLNASQTHEKCQVATGGDLKNREIFCPFHKESNQKFLRRSCQHCILQRTPIPGVSTSLGCKHFQQTNNCHIIRCIRLVVEMFKCSLVFFSHLH